MRTQCIWWRGARESSTLHATGCSGPTDPLSARSPSLKPLNDSAGKSALWMSFIATRRVGWLQDVEYLAAHNHAAGCNELRPQYMCTPRHEQNSAIVRLTVQSGLPQLTRRVLSRWPCEIEIQRLWSLPWLSYHHPAASSTSVSSPASHCGHYYRRRPSSTMTHRCTRCQSCLLHHQLLSWRHATRHHHLPAEDPPI